jgi:hypothetical protein
MQHTKKILLLLLLLFLLLIIDKLMESLNLCPNFFSKENGARPFLRHDLLYQMVTLKTPKSELLVILPTLETKLQTSNFEGKYDL